MDSLIIGNVRRLTDECNKKRSELGGNDIGLKMKVGYAELVRLERGRIFSSMCSMTTRVWHPSTDAFVIWEGKFSMGSALGNKRWTSSISNVMKRKVGSIVDMRCINTSGRKSSSERCVCGKDNHVDNTNVSELITRTSLMIITCAVRFSGSMVAH